MIRLFDNFQVIANTNLEFPNVVGKSVMSRALTSPKTQLESLSVSSMTRKKHQHTISFILPSILC
ncbi:unnamed protein product [Brassica rapa]|uniref:Uncharacterized protein n=1 Tax=Brassica campestris TaxID=3711 RepID=A0A8D9M1B0_BRACM|nr:unnamed protein product [Brassica rapa]